MPDLFKEEFVTLDFKMEEYKKSPRLGYPYSEFVSSIRIPIEQRVKLNFREIGWPWSKGQLIELTGFSVAPVIHTMHSLGSTIYGRFSLTEPDRHRLGFNFREYDFEYFASDMRLDKIQQLRKLFTKEQRVDTWSPDRVNYFTVAQRFYHFLGLGINHQNTPSSNPHKYSRYL